jgi:YaiO family outer membrane protein
MRFKFTFIFLIFIAINSSIISQVNTDSIFQTALNQAKNNQFSQAIENAKKALLTTPNRGDLLVFIANVYSWKSKNDSAMIFINRAKALNYKHDDFYEAWLNILLRTHQSNSLLTACDEATKNNYSNTEDLLQKRALAYSDLQMYDNGIQLMELPENKKFLDSKAIGNLYTDILIKRNKKLISAYYILDMFDGGPVTTAQHLASLGYSFPIGNNNLGFRMNYANRFNIGGVQLESDFYYKLLNKQYIYFNYGYAFNSVLFPNHRFGFEYYFPLPAKMEASVGGRYLNYPASNVLIATGHLAKYFGKSWISIRPFYVYSFKSSSNTESFTLLANYRLFGKSELDYWGVELGIGNSPDEIYSTSQVGGFNQSKAYKIKLEKNLRIDRTSDLHITLGYSDEEYTINQYRNRFTIELGYKIRLK